MSYEKHRNHYRHTKKSFQFCTVRNNKIKEYMMLWWKVFIIAVIVLLLFLLEKLLRKKWNIPRKSITERYVNDTHKWIERYMLIGYLIVSGILIFMFKNIYIRYLIGIYLLVLFIARAWMEWKYDRESREYKLEICNIVGFLFMIGLLEYLF